MTSTTTSRRLHALGYAQELARRLSGFSNFAISLSIICILAGGVTSFHLGLVQRRGRVDRPGLAAGVPVRAGGRGDDGAARLDVSHGRRPVSLGVDPGRPRLGLGHRLVQPGRAGHRAGRDQCRDLSLRLECAWARLTDADILT